MLIKWKIFVLLNGDTLIKIQTKPWLYQSFCYLPGLLWRIHDKTDSLSGQIETNVPFWRRQNARLLTKIAKNLFGAHNIPGAWTLCWYAEQQLPQHWQNWLQVLVRRLSILLNFLSYFHVCSKLRGPFQYFILWIRTSRSVITSKYFLCLSKAKLQKKIWIFR